MRGILGFTANNIECAKCYVVEEVEALLTVHLLGHLLHENRALLLENVDEIFQDLEVECRRQDLQTKVESIGGNVVQCQAAVHVPNNISNLSADARERTFLLLCHF